MYIIKFSTQQHNGIYDMTNNLKIIISVRGGELTFFAVFTKNHLGHFDWNCLSARYPMRPNT